MCGEVRVPEEHLEVYKLGQIYIYLSSICIRICMWVPEERLKVSNLALIFSCVCICSQFVFEDMILGLPRDRMTGDGD